jgi:ribosome biogenesis SPOUT family RNA methylase Rps3
MAKFVIEHLELEMYPWCVIEYSHMSKRVGKTNLMFTNVSKGADKIKALGDVRKDSIKDIPLKKACVLDPAAKRLLTPEEAKKFDYFIFGGILVDNPQRFRTKKLITSKLKLPAYNLGDKQMSTDTAVIVCKKIVDGTPLSKLKFVEEYEIEEEPGLYRVLPYRYIVEKGKVVFAPNLKSFLRTLKPSV